MTGKRRMVWIPNDPNDANGDCNGDGYTNLEKYLNSLVGEYSLMAKIET